MQGSLVTLVVLAGLGCAACGQTVEPTPSRMTPSAVTVDNMCFVDSEGRQVLLRGLNAVDKSVDWTQWPWQGRESYIAMAEWGLNCVRLGFTWASLEPEPGRYGEACLAEIDKRIAWAEEAGLYVFLDMHQDLYSVLYSDGAPEWATLTDGKPHIHQGGVWSDAYLTSPAVQTAFDNFWANKPGPDGVGIQDRYAMAWAHLAKRYADNPTVIGYDLMNEPFIGSAILPAQVLMVQKFAELVSAAEGEGALSVEDILGQWTDPAGRSKLMARLRDMDVYVPAIDAAEAAYQEFERTTLTAMFQRVTKAIRKVDPYRMIFLETSMSANMGVYSGIDPVLGPDGRRDPQQAYAPHGYDIVVDTADLALSSNDRVELIFTRHGETAKRLDMPVIVGEWGAFPSSAKGVLPAGRFLVRQFEKLLCGDFFWCYVQGIPESEFFEIINRPYPVAVAGELVAYEGNPETHVFTCVWKDDPAVMAPSLIYLPEAYFPGDSGVDLSPAGQGFTVKPVRPGSRGIHLIIPPTGEVVERRLSVGAKTP